MKSCGNCTYARQRGKLSDQNIIGCCKIYYDNRDNRLYEDDEHLGLIPIYLSGTGDIYSGWYYNCRRVGDVAESNALGKGAITNGVLVDNTQCCNKWRGYND